MNNEFLESKIKQSPFVFRQNQNCNSQCQVEEKEDWDLAKAGRFVTAECYAIIYRGSANRLLGALPDAGVLSVLVVWSMRKPAGF